MKKLVLLISLLLMFQIGYSEGNKNIDYSLLTKIELEKGKDIASNLKLPAVSLSKIDSKWYFIGGALLTAITIDALVLSSIKRNDLDHTAPENLVKLIGINAATIGLSIVIYINE